ncbi:hypothetical protein D3C77_598010 [compost metagenome]
MDAHQLQRLELRAGCEDFVGYFVRCCHADNRQAVFGLAVRLIAVEDLDVLLAGFAVEALSAEKCNFHSRTCHLCFLSLVRFIALLCFLQAERSRASKKAISLRPACYLACGLSIALFKRS